MEAKANQFVDEIIAMNGIGENGYIDEKEIPKVKEDFMKAYKVAPNLMNLILIILDRG